MSDNPDYEGLDGARLRAEAKHCAEERSRLFDEATALREAGDHPGANRLVEEGKRMGERMKEKNREAAAAIVRYNNADAGEDYLDLHGLREEEAMEYLKERVERLERSTTAGSFVDFRLIPGAGHHSGPAGQKLMGAAERYFKSRRIEYEQINAGTLMAKVPGKAPADAVPAAAPPSAAAAAADGAPKPVETPSQETKSKSSCCLVM